MQKKKEKKKLFLSSFFLKIFLFHFCIHVKFHLWITCHFIQFFICAYVIHIHTLGHKVKCFLPNLYCIDWENGRPIGYPNQCRQAHPRGIWTWRLGNRRIACQVNKLVERHIEVEIIYPKGLHLCLFNRHFTFLHITPIQITDQVSRPWATFLQELTAPTMLIPSV